MNKLRWGILSTAHIAREKVIPGIQKADRCDVVAIASRDADQARRVADQLGIPKAHGSYEALLAEAGRPVVCEKPLAMSAAEAEGMVDVCRAEGIRLMEAFMYRLHPSWIAVRGLVASGRIGRLLPVQGWFSYSNEDAANLRNSRAYGGGALMDIGCYSVNLSRMLFGGEPVRVEASVTRDPTPGVDVRAR